MEPLSLSQAATKFEAYVLTERRASANTVAAYRRDIAQFVAYCQEHTITLNDLTPAHMQRFIQYLKGQGVGARSIARKLSAIKLFFSYLASCGYATAALSEQLVAPKLEKSLPHFLTEDEIARLLAIADADISPVGKRNQALLYVLYGTGMRISELVMLKVSNIHWESGMLCVQGKGGKERMIPVPAPILDLLKTYIEMTRSAELAAHHGQETPYVFSAYYAGEYKPLTRQACWIILKKMWKKTGIAKPLSPHKLRHSLATHLLKKGADLRSLQLILGHENIATVAIYTHVEMSHLREVYDKKHPRSK